MTIVTEVDGWSVNEAPAAFVVEKSDPAIDICTPDALDLVARLSRAHGHAREILLARRTGRVQALRNDGTIRHVGATAHVPTTEWRVAPAPADLLDRRCEITGPADRKMIIAALNSGARAFMADLEDSLSPTWTNVVAGHRNLRDAADMTISFERPDGTVDTVHPDHATLMVRPRGLHLLEPRVVADNRPAPASIFDVALLGLHLAVRRATAGSGLYLYLPKIESYFEAQWWDALIADVERCCGLPANSIRVSVLIETVPAAYQMEEILFALRERVTALNAGRWDYLFSMIKVLGVDCGRVLADRQALTMTVPFMASYAERLVDVCHRRGAHAIGGMAAIVPDRRDELANQRALDLVYQDKAREAAIGYDGTWVAHPDLVAVATAAFDEVLGDRPSQLEHLPEGAATATDLMDTATPGSGCTFVAAERNVSIAHEYLVNWLEGRGAVAIDHLMEDLATAEISRAQIWQWLQSGTKLDAAGDVPIVLDDTVISGLVDRSRDRLLAAHHNLRAISEAGAILISAVTERELPPFLSLLAMDTLETLSTADS